MEYIKRENYLNELESFKDKKIIKVISGLHRAGKSTLLMMYRDYLLKNGVNSSEIIFINFEDLENESLKDYLKLNEYILSRLVKNKINYIFLDEIQWVPSFEKTIDSLFLKSNVDIYITGSNAYFMSNELATLLSGRYVEIRIMPLSFKEYVSATSKDLSLETKFSNYITYSSYPYTLQFNNEDQIYTYLKGIYNTTLLKDILQRNKIDDVNSLENLIRFIYDNIGNKLSTRAITNTLVSYGTKIDAKTVDKYLSAIVNSMMVNKAARYNISGKKILQTEEKYYVTDVSLRNILLKKNEVDFGHIIENVVYLELVRRGYEVYVGQFDKTEVDFVAFKNKSIQYIQVTSSILNKETLLRELKPLKSIKTDYDKLIISYDNIVDGDYDGIKTTYLLRWLLN